MNPAAARSGRLAELGRLADADFPLAEAALWLAVGDQPDARDALPRRLARLDALAAGLAPLAARDDPAEQAAGLAALVVPVPPDDAEPADFGTVVDHGWGEPDALAVLLLDLGRRGGLALHALAFPAALLLRLDGADGRRVIIDPAAPAHPLTPADLRALLKAVCGPSHELQRDHFIPLAPRAVLARARNAVKARLLRQGRLDLALALVEDLLRVAPDLSPLWREAGLMHLRRGARDHALAALQQFVQRTADAKARARTLNLMAELRARPF